MQRILITGGTGSLGERLVKHYASDSDYEITVLSRDPHRQMALQKELGNYPARAIFVLGDIRNYETVVRVCEGQDIVVHAAALKFVGLGETQVEEFITVNIGGSLNVGKACLEQGVKRSLLISSDKAVSPVNLYGKTKAVAEDYFTSINYNVLRYGNVVESRGSFLWIWNESETIVLRKPFPTRFFVTFSEAISLIESSLAASVTRPGEIFVPGRLRAFSLEDVAKTVFPNKPVEEQALLSGEKQHEVLVSDSECAIPLGSGHIWSVIKGSNKFAERWRFSSKDSMHMTLYDLKEKMEDILNG